MAPKPLSQKIVDEYHNFDIWRQITNTISTEVGDLNNLPDDLQTENLTTAVTETYNTTQVRLRHMLIKSIGMS